MANEKDAMALAVLDRAVRYLDPEDLIVGPHMKADAAACVREARAHLAARVAELEKIAIAAKKAQWLHAACWDLADGSGCVIPTEQMARFDEVFNDLGRALGDIVPLDEEDERELFERPFARATRAEAELAAVIKAADYFARNFSGKNSDKLKAAIAAAREGK